MLLRRKNRNPDEIAGCLRYGSKVLLSRLLYLSQSNMAYRLHGKKRLDEAEAERITTVLGLPSGWLDMPRDPAEVPKAVADTLMPSGRRRSSLQSPTSAKDTSPIATNHRNVQGASERVDQPARPPKEAEAGESEARIRFKTAVSGALGKKH